MSRLQPGPVDEVVGLDPGEGVGEAVAAVVGDVVGVDVELAGRPFPDRPGLRGRAAHRGVLRREPPVVGAHQVAPLDLGDRLQVLVPGVREEPARPLLVEPEQLLAAQEEDAAQHEAAHALRVLLRVGQGQGAAPAAAEDEPLVDAEALADALGVGHEVPGGVLAQLRVGRALAAAALVVEREVPLRGIEVAPVVGVEAAAGPAVEEEGLLPLRVADLLVVDGVEVGDLQEAVVEGLDRGVEFAHGHLQSAGAGIVSRGAIEPGRGP